MAYSMVNLSTEGEWTNATTENPSNKTPFVRDENLAKVEIGVSSLIFALALIGNTTVLLVLLFRKHKLSRMLFFILHLSIADLFTAFFSILPQLIMDVTFKFYGGAFLCKFIHFCQLAAMYASAYVLVMTAIDRYMAICYPLNSQTWTPRRAHFMILIAWALTVVLSSPSLFIFDYILWPLNNTEGRMDCHDLMFDWEEWAISAYVIWIAVSVWIIPVLILTFTYGHISAVVWMSMVSKEPSLKKRKSSKEAFSSGAVEANGSPNRHAPRAHVQRLSRAKMKTVKLTLTVVIVYFVCWSPYFVCQIWWTFDFTAAEASANVIFMLMANLNSCTNPLIYLVFVDILRHQFCRKGRRRSSSLYSDSTRSTRINFSNSLHYSTVNTVGSKKDSYNSRGALMLKQLHRVSDKNKDNCKIEVASV